MDPEQEPAPHGQGRMHPFDTVPPEVRGPLIPVHTLSPQVLCDLRVMLLRPLGGDLLEPVTVLMSTPQISAVPASQTPQR